jgi:ABC-type nickel/cobalt efflux system permease component RcnA
VRPKQLAIDLGAVVVLVSLVLIFSPGLAVTGIVALLVVVVCAVSFAWRPRRSR